MKRLQKLQQSYPIRADVRVEPVRFGKYVYLTMLTVLCTGLIHTLFGHLYLLRGDGFIYADNEDVALEFDATIETLAVDEGEQVSQGQLLLRYDSVALHRQLVELALQISRLEREYENAQIDRVRVEAALAAASDYAEYSEELEQTLRNVKGQGLIASTQLGSQLQRSFNAVEALTGYQAEQRQLENALRISQENIKRVQIHYQALLAAFGDGEVKAGRDGVVTQLQVTQGSVLKAGTAALRLFDNKRYILCYFDERSFVSYRTGDKVLVSLPHKRFAQGTIKTLTQVSEPLPDEFQPRFRQRERQQLALIEVAPELLAGSAVLGTVKLYKPPFMEWLVALWPS